MLLFTIARSTTPHSVSCSGGYYGVPRSLENVPGRKRQYSRSIEDTGTLEENEEEVTKLFAEWLQEKMAGYGL
jgi:hypothetical protein